MSYTYRGPANVLVDKSGVGIEWLPGTEVKVDLDEPQARLMAQYGHRFAEFEQDAAAVPLVSTDAHPIPHLDDAGKEIKVKRQKRAAVTAPILVGLAQEGKLGKGALAAQPVEAELQPAAASGTPA